MTDTPTTTGGRSRPPCAWCGAAHYVAAADRCACGSALARGWFCETAGAAVGTGTSTVNTCSRCGEAARTCVRVVDQATREPVPAGGYGVVCEATARYGTDRCGAHGRDGPTGERICQMKFCANTVGRRVPTVDGIRLCRPCRDSALRVVEDNQARADVAAGRRPDPRVWKRVTNDDVDDQELWRFKQVQRGELPASFRWSPERIEMLRTYRAARDSDPGAIAALADGGRLDSAGPDPRDPCAGPARGRGVSVRKGGAVPTISPITVSLLGVLRGTVWW